MSSLLAVVERSSEQPDVRSRTTSSASTRRRGRRPDGAAGGRGSALVRERSAVSALRRTTCSSPRRIVTLLGVEVLEQRLGELARGPELVAQLGQRDRAPVLGGDRDHAPADVRQHIGVVMQRPETRTARPASRSAGQVGGVELGVQRRLEARPRAGAARARAPRPTSGSRLGPGPARASARTARFGRCGRAPPAPRATGAPGGRAGRATGRACGGGGRARRRRRACPAARSGARPGGRRRAATSGCSSRTCQKRPPSQASRAGASRVPWWIWTRSPCSGSSAAELELGVEQIARSQVRRRRRRPRRRGRPRRPPRR